MKGTIYFRKAASCGEYRFVCCDGQVHLTIRHDDEVFHEDTLIAVLPCNGSCVRGEMEIPSAFGQTIFDFLDRNETFRADGKRHLAIRVSTRPVGA